jgi:multidrug efflux pump
MLAALAASVGLFTLVPRELAPTEDRGAFFVRANGPEGGGYDYTVKQLAKVEQALLSTKAATSPCR